MGEQGDLRDGRGPTAWFDRFSAIPGLLITSCACYTLLGLQLSGFRGSESLLAWTKENKTQIAIGVQILSHALGIIHIQVLCTILKNSFMLHAATKSFPIYLAQFIQAASTPRMTWSLPWKLCISLVIIITASFIPAAIWAGSLTPLTSEYKTTRSLYIPSFDVANTSALFEGDSSTAVGAPDLKIDVWNSSQGLFSFYPSWSKDLFLQSAAEASVVTGEPWKHVKLDKTGYAYLDRSYGAGAIAGFNDFDGIQSPTWFTYVEPGLSGKVSCFYNHTISDSFRYVEVSSGVWGILAQAVGSNAFNSALHYTTYYGIAWSELFAWLTAYDIATRTLAVSMITRVNESSHDFVWEDRLGFGRFNNIQCNIKFEANLFEIYVNATNKLIKTTPMNATAQIWPSYADTVIDKVSHWLWVLTSIDGCVNGCQIGRSLVLNVERLRNVTSDYSNSTLLKATEDFLGSLVDDTMVNLLLTRMASSAPEPTKEVLAAVNVPAVVFGELRFIITIAVLNTVVASMYTIMLFRTRAWSGLPLVDLTNLSDMIICAAKGGMIVAEQDAFSAEQSRSWKKSSWTYSRAEPFTDSVKIRLRHDKHKTDMPALVPLLENMELPSESAEVIDLRSTHEIGLVKSDVQQIVVQQRLLPVNFRQHFGEG